MKINWTKPAEQDLDSVYNYIFQDNPSAAVDTVLLIMQKVEEMIPPNPAIGRPGRVMGTRELIIANYPYIVAYRVQDNTIEVLRVLHSSMQWPDIL